MENFEKIRLPWADWKIVKYLGGGAYGKVYEIERNISGVQEKAALKIVSRPKDDSEIETYYDEGYDKASIVASYDREIQNYVQEYTLMKKLQGQTNIVSCDDFTVVPHANKIGGDIFIRMELLTSLQQVLRQKTLSVQEIIKLGKDISNALILCERKNIVHRDIKPANIMVSEFGDYKLGDFGVSKIMDHTTYATAMGTLEYEAPEVRRMERYGKSADIYSLVITLYWLLNDRRMPFIDAKKKLTPELKINAMERRYRGEKLPVPKNGSEELKKVVLKACEYRPENRYASAQELYDALYEIESGKSYTKNPVSGYQTEPSSEDDGMENGKTVGKTVGGFSSGQTAGNSWGGGGTIGRTIGKLKGNTEKKKKEENQKEVQEEPITETIGVKKAYQQQEKKVEEKKAEAKKVVTAKNETKKVKKTKVGYIWSLVIIGFFVAMIIEARISGEYGLAVVFGCIAVLPQLFYLLFKAEKTYKKRWKMTADGVVGAFIVMIPFAVLDSFISIDDKLGKLGKLGGVVGLILAFLVFGVLCVGFWLGKGIGLLGYDDKQE